MSVRVSAVGLVLLVSCSTTPPPAASFAIPIATATTAAAATVTAPPMAWRRIADIPTPRSEVAAAVFRENVYVIGGFGGGRVVEVFDGQSWRKGPDLPIEVDHAMAAAIEDGASAGVYLVGGNTPAPTARAFKLESAGWKEIAKMPAPRSQGAAVARGSAVYIVGGYDGQRLVAPTYAYDAIADRWTTVAPIPTPRDHLAAARVADRICAVGGRRLSLTTNLATLECYEPGADRWEKLPDAPTARGGVGAAVVRDRMVFVGGEQPTGTYREVEIFDPRTRSWSRAPDLPTPRHGIGVAALRNTVYVMSGGPTPGGSQTPVCEALDIR